jgi:hypothetical protein
MASGRSSASHVTPLDHPLAPPYPSPPDGPVAPGYPAGPENPVAPAWPVAPPSPISQMWLQDVDSMNEQRAAKRSRRGSWQPAGKIAKVGTALAAKARMPTAAFRERDAEDQGRPERSLRRTSRRSVQLLSFLVGAGILAGLIESNHGSNGSHPAKPVPHALASTATGNPAQAASAAHPNGTIAGVTMPNTGGGTLPLHPLRLLLIVDNPANVSRTDLTTLGMWITSHERHGSLVRVLSGRDRLSTPLSPDGMTAAPSMLAGDRQQAVKWLRGGKHYGLERPARLLVEVGARRSRPIAQGVDGAVIRLATGAPVPSANTADPRRRDSITAAIALRIIEAADQSESEAPRIR